MKMEFLRDMGIWIWYLITILVIIGSFAVIIYGTISSSQKAEQLELEKEFCDYLGLYHDRDRWHEEFKCLNISNEGEILETKYYNVDHTLIPTMMGELGE